MSEELKPCPFCGHSIDIEKDVYEPSRDWHPTFIDPDKVVEILKELRDRFDKKDFAIRGIIEKAIEIVKTGGRY